jgi:hypothetical protein
VWDPYLCLGFLISALVILGTEKIVLLTHKIFSQLIEGATSFVALAIPRLDSRQFLVSEKNLRRFTGGGKSNGY